ncbi:MAG: Trm112 family protein [Chthonomonadales bacterium]|nr:Trm112 family protein [Chthonomonadales bacterium]
MIDPKLLEILACPACDERPPVALQGEELVCAVCGRRYPIRDGIPVMLVDEAVVGTPGGTTTG